MSRRQMLAWMLGTLLLVFAGMSYATGVGDVTIKLNGGANVAYIGETNTLEIWIQNDAALSLMTMCFKVDINQPYSWVKPYGNKPTALPVVKEEGDALGKWVSTGGLTVIDRIFNTKPDTIYLNGNGTPNLSVHATPTLEYTLKFDISSLAAPTTGGVCIDNVVFPPTGYWAFNDGTLYAPKFQGNGNANISNPTAPAICFDIIQRANALPVFSNCPGALQVVLCSQISYDFDAFDPDGTAITYSLVSSPGSINPTTGLWTFTAGSSAGVGSLTVRATDAASAFKDCVVQLNFQNTAPYFVNACGQTVSGSQSQELTFDFNAADPNACDGLIYSLAGVTPAPSGSHSVNSISGVLSFTPAAPDVGNAFTFTVNASDGDTSVGCIVYVVVPPALPTDTDQDTKLNASDNCPHTYNPTQTDTDGDSIGDACDADVVCGDANSDHTVNISDPVFMITYVFAGGPAPSPLCEADVTGEGTENVGDIVAMINYIFMAGVDKPENCCCPAGKMRLGPFWVLNTTGAYKRGCTVDLTGTSNALSNAKVVDFTPGCRILTVDAIQNKVSIDFQVNCIAPNDSVSFYICAPSPSVGISTVTWR